jgi:hypothetical protein
MENSSRGIVLDFIVMHTPKTKNDFLSLCFSGCMMLVVQKHWDFRSCIRVILSEICLQAMLLVYP